MSTRILLALVPLFAIVAPARGQQPSPSSTPAVTRAIERWRHEHGEGWRARVREETGRVRMLSGGVRAAEWLPASERDWIELAVRRFEEVEPLFGVAVSTLESLEVKHVELARIGTTDKTVVRFRQAPGGIPVEGGGASAIFGPDGELLCVDSTALPDADEVALEPLVLQGDAEYAAREEFLRAEGVGASAVDEHRLVVTADRSAGGSRARLAWAVGLTAATSTDELPKSRRVLVAADTRGREILSSRSRVHEAWTQVQLPGSSSGTSAPSVSRPIGDMDGYVGSMATPGLQADWSGNPPVYQALGSMEVQSSQGNAVTLPDGRFVLPYTGSAHAAVTFRFEGPWVRVNNMAGPSTSWTVNVSPNATQVWTMNLPSSEFQTAEANAFLHVNRFREHVAGLDPSDATMDFQADANVNIDNACNAYYDGSSVNFYRELSWCNNTAFSTIVAHEMGHWANDLYGSGNGPDGFGEGAADAWAMYIFDTPLVGELFFLGGGTIRDGENARQFCGDTYANYPNGCYGEVHDDGEVLMGALWKARRNLNNSLGNALGDQTADVLFLSWMQAFDDSQIHSVIEEHWLVLDDDDGHLNNGTPHFTEIDDAFLEQGFPGFVIGQTETFKLTASDAAAEDRFGWSVAVDGTKAVVGAYGNDDGGSLSGSAYLFNTTTGQQLFKLTASDAAAGNDFGWSVAIHGGLAIVGAREDDDRGTDSGSAYLFNTTTGQQLFKLTASDGATEDEFGFSVGISGTRAIVGSHGNDDGGSASGSAYLFDTTTGQQLFKLTASDAAVDDRFGYSVAISGTRAIVGAYGNDDDGSQSGSAYLFNTTTGQQLYKFTASDAAAGDWFGFSVALSGTTAMVGALLDDGSSSNSGSAYLFNTTTGQQLLKLTASNAAANDEFGFSVSINGTTAIAGAYGNDDAGNNSGSAHVFDTTTGQQIFKLVAADAAAGDSFGWRVGISGRTTVVGAYGNDDAGSNSGSGYVFSLP